MHYDPVEANAPMAEAIPIDNVQPELPHVLPVNVRDLGQKNENAPLKITKNHEPLSTKQIQSLEDVGFTRGMSKCLEEMKDALALRIWVVDNSGSMLNSDGHRIVSAKNKKDTKMVQCTRWEEVKQCLECHIKLAGLIKAPTHFRLLNDPGANVGRQKFSVAEDPSSNKIAQDVQDALAIMKKVKPGGRTPLTRHIREIHMEVSQVASELQMLGKKIAIVIVTDSLPTDENGACDYQQQQEFIEAVRQLEGLPVWVVVRLCTDEKEVVNFYVDMDNKLELSLEVLDDFYQEAGELTEENPWLNYGLPLHRMREMGYHDRIFDLLDERGLTKDELREFCSMLFGRENGNSMADPSLDWKGFMKDVKGLLRKEAPEWNPVTKKMSPWINTKKMNEVHGHKRWFQH